MLVSRRKPISGGGGGVSPTRAIYTSIPLLGGGDLSADRTHTFGPFNNNQFMQGRLSSTTAKNLLGINASDKMIIGESGIIGSQINTYLEMPFMGSGIGSSIVLSRMTTAQVTAEPTIEAKLVYDSTLKVIKYWDGTQWVTLTTGSFVAPTRTINTTSPLTGGGNLSADRTFALGPFNNNAFLQGRLTTTVIKNLIGINGSDGIDIGQAGIFGVNIHSYLSLTFMGSGIGSGLLLPQLTTVEETAEPPSEGKVIYNTDLNVVTYWDGTQWVRLGQSTSPVTRVILAAKSIRADNTIPEVHGGARWDAAEHDISGTRKIYFRAIIQSEDNATFVYVKLWNATTQNYVTNLDGLGNAYLRTNSINPTLLTSHNLNGVGGDNFNESLAQNYEAHYYTSDPNVFVIAHFAEIIVTS